MTVAQGIGAGERTSNEVSADRAGPDEPGRRGRRSTPYLLLLPGLGWLAIFFAVPIFTLISTSTQTRPSGAEIGVYEQTFRFANYVDALSEYATQFGRSFVYALLATALALAISYPLAYAIAFKAGRWRNLLLVLVVAPFFTSFLLRTIAWKQILADGAWVADVSAVPARARATGPCHQHPGRGRAGHHLQLPAVHDPADLREPRAGRPTVHGGGRRPLRQRHHDVPQGDPAAVDARRGGGHAADVHPRGRRLRQQRAAGQP